MSSVKMWIMCCDVFETIDDSTDFKDFKRGSALIKSGLYISRSNIMTSKAEFRLVCMSEKIYCATCIYTLTPLPSIKKTPVASATES